MTDTWIAAAPALEQVVAVELNPQVAETKLIEAIKRGTMPAKVVSAKGERFLLADLFRGRHGWIKIDFDTGAGRYQEGSIVAGEPPYSEWSFHDLVLSRRHLDELWPASNQPQKPARHRVPQAAHLGNGIGRAQFRNGAHRGPRRYRTDATALK